MNSAVLSPDGNYRYLLSRRWTAPLEPDPHEATVLFVMLNPSTADASRDDPTIRRCVGFARRWGYTELLVANLYGWRATSPNDLFAAADPIGPANESYLRWAAADRSPLIVCAWGAHGAKNGRGRQVLETLRSVPDRARGPIYCLGTTKSGEPKHPLYVRGDTEPVPL